MSLAFGQKKTCVEKPQRNQGNFSVALWVLSSGSCFVRGEFPLNAYTEQGCGSLLLSILQGSVMGQMKLCHLQLVPMLPISCHGYSMCYKLSDSARVQCEPVLVVNKAL